MMKRNFHVDDRRRYTPRYNPYLTPQKPIPVFVPQSPERKPTPLRCLNFSTGLDEVQYNPVRQGDGSVYQRVRCRTDFEELGSSPNLKMVPSRTGILPLSDPLNVVYNEAFKQWIVADRKLGIVCISQDVSHVLHTYTVPCLRSPSAVILLDNGTCAGVLDDNGIHILEFKTGQFSLIYPIRRCRGLGMTALNDFVTFDTAHGQLLIIPQDGTEPITREYKYRTYKNEDGEPSRVSFIGVSDRRIWLTDYTLGFVVVYRYDPLKRNFMDECLIDCTQNVAQCRLTGCYVDNCGRALVANCKERILRHFDHDGRSLLDVEVEGGLCRSGGIYVNSTFQTLVVDLHSQPPSVKLYKLTNMNRNLFVPMAEVKTEVEYPMIVPSEVDPYHGYPTTSSLKTSSHHKYPRMNIKKGSTDHKHSRISSKKPVPDHQYPSISPRRINNDHHYYKISSRRTSGDRQELRRTPPKVNSHLPSNEKKPLLQPPVKQRNLPIPLTPLREDLSELRIDDFSDLKVRDCFDVKDVLE